MPKMILAVTFSIALIGGAHASVYKRGKRVRRRR
jgi:hypothetical protein